MKILPRHTQNIARLADFGCLPTIIPPLNRLPHIRTLHINWFRVLTLFNDIEHEPQGLTYYTEFGFPQRNGHRWKKYQLTKIVVVFAKSTSSLQISREYAKNFGTIMASSSWVSAHLNLPKLWLQQNWHKDMVGFGVLSVVLKMWLFLVTTFQPFHHKITKTKGYQGWLDRVINMASQLTPLATLMKRSFTKREHCGGIEQREVLTGLDLLWIFFFLHKFSISTSHYSPPNY